jgi:IclR helix-turn-helix domain
MTSKVAHTKPLAFSGQRPVPSGDPYFMESLARGLSVIRAFSGGRTPLTGAEVAAATGLSRAAARRCLHTLTRPPGSMRRP